MYRTVDSRFWMDPKVRSLDPDAKLVFLYLITCPHSHVSGLYYLPVEIGILETGLTEIRYREGIDHLFRFGMVKLDEENHLIWVVNMLAYQGRGEKNERSAANQIRSLHKSRLFADFLRRYPGVKQYGIDRRSIRHPAQGEVGTPEQEQEQEQDDATSVASCPESDEAASGPVVPEELKGLHLYETDMKLLRRWPDLIASWTSAYPGVDLTAAIRTAHAWEVANPKRQKVNKARFLNAWLARQQDRGPRPPAAEQSKAVAHEEFMADMRRRMAEAQEAKGESETEEEGF